MKTTINAVVLLLLQISFVGAIGCSRSKPAAPPEKHEEPEAIARTEFTGRIENYFEYEPLHAGKSSQVRIHLTDLNDGSPVAQAEVSLTVRHKGTSEAIVQTTAQIGKVTGIYVAQLNVPQSGAYDVEFRVKNSVLDETLALANFKVE